MFIKQQSNNKNFFTIRENTHSTLSIFVFIFIILLMLFILVISSITKTMILIIFASLCFIVSLIKLINQIIIKFKLKKLIKKIGINNISFYIAKSWTRKKQSTIWISLTWLFILLLFIMFSLIFIDKKSLDFILSLTILSSLLFLIIIFAYLNFQIIDGYLKRASKKINFNSIEWIEIIKDQKVFYRLIFIWVVSILTLFPLLLMIIPAYRNFIYKIIKN